MPTDTIKVDHAGCCGVCARVKVAIGNCLSRFWGRRQQGITPANVLSEEKDDLSDEDGDTASKDLQREESTQKEDMQKPSVEETVRPDAMVKKLIEEFVAVELRKALDKDGSKPLEEYEVRQILQGPLKPKIREIMQFSLSNNEIMELLQNKPIDEEQIKQKLQLVMEYAFKEKELVKIVKENVSVSKESKMEKIDPYFSDDEGDSHGKGNGKVKKGRRGKTVRGGSLRIMDNLERVLGAFVTARYYRALVVAALSEYLETGLLIFYPLKFLPPVGMMCGVYIVSNIGSPQRLTLRALVLSGLIAEVLFAVVAEVVFGRSIQILACVVCTLLAVKQWEWPKADSDGQSSKPSCYVVTLCACVVMMIVWGGIIMNTTIEVDGDNVTISTALHNFYNSPAWTQMKVALWDIMIMYLTGDYDEANETLLRMSDLSGAERALAMLGLPRDADEASIKAQYKKLAREWHPDKYQGEDKEAATDKFIEIQKAYTLLTKRIRA